MRKYRRFAAAGLAAATVVAMGLGSSVANAAPRCRAPVSGDASSLGILGTGSAKARVEARRNWEANAAAAYGRRYASFYFARGVRWDCKPGFILPATCVVTASPCRY
jgi:hypothetical protein